MLPQAVHEPCAENGSENIDSDSGTVSEERSDVPEYFLMHKVMGTDVEHIDIPIRIEGEITYGCKEAAEQVNPCASDKA